MSDLRVAYLRAYIARLSAVQPLPVIDLPARRPEAVRRPQAAR